MENVYYQSLAATIHGFVSKGIRKLAITSGGPEEGKSTITAHLGRALAGSGRESVVLVDTDRVKPTLHQILGVDNSPGLGEFLKEVYQVEVGNGKPNQFGLGDWVELLRVQARTGRLLVAEDGQEFSILFRKGRISHIVWQQRPEDRRLGMLLVRAGRITEDQIGAALKLQQQTCEPLGDALCRLGHLEPADLESPLQSQHKDCLHKMFTLRKPEILFTETVEADHPSEIRNGTGGDGLIVGRFKDYLKQPFLSGQIPSYLKDTDIPNLKVLTGGEAQFDLQDHTVLEQFGALLDKLAQRFDIVLIDSPPVALTSPAATLAMMADGVLWVVKSDGLDVAIIQQAKEQLVKAGANILGVVLNQVDLKHDPSLSYYYGAYRR